MSDLSDLKRDIDFIYCQTRTKPQRIKVNKKWINDQIKGFNRGFDHTPEHVVPLIDNENKHDNQIFGIPFEVDDSVVDYEFVYEWSKHPYIL